VDDRLALSGSFCTQPPDEVAFPVKVLVVIDQSASLQCTDPGNARLALLSEAGLAVDALPNVSFATVGFASWSRAQPFTTDWAEAALALAPEAGQGGPATDYQGALATAVRVLEADMVAAGPAENARTRYVVLFLSDGVPEPRCTAGCDDGDILPDSLYAVCNTDREIPEGDYVDITAPCPAYNQAPQILGKVRQLNDLAERYGVADIRLDTVLLFAPEEEVAAVCGDVSGFGYVREEAAPLLQQMALEGGGTYRDVDTAAGSETLDFGYVAIDAPYRLSELYPVNQRAIGTATGLVPDSDGDGLSDADELTLGTDPLRVDSDGDGWGDRLEDATRRQGFDPLDALAPAWACDDTEDRDGDGLRTCEELWLGSSPILPDTDRDHVPDGLEVRMGMDPTVPDGWEDPDRDGVPNRDELRGGTHPRIANDEISLLSSTSVAVAEREVLANGARCYDWSVEDLRLVVPRSREEGKGTNRVMLFLEEEPEGVGAGRGLHHAACVEPRYLGPTFRAPADGRVDGMSSAAFSEFARFDPEQHCASPSEDAL
jgi:hypothetical protein